MNANLKIGIQPCEIITEESLTRLRRNFGTPATYVEHMDVLWTARKIVFKQIESCGELSKDHELFPLFNTLNKLINDLHNPNIYDRCKLSLSNTEFEMIE